MARAYYKGEEIEEVEKLYGDIYTFRYVDTKQYGKALLCQIIVEYD